MDVRDRIIACYAQVAFLLADLITKLEDAFCASDYRDKNLEPVPTEL